MNSKPKAHIAIDASNVHYSLVNKGWTIDWEKFITFFKSRWEISLAIFYCGIESQSVFQTNHPELSVTSFLYAKRRKMDFFKRLKNYGYRVKYKPVTQLYDSTSGKFVRKCNFDVEITIDAIRYRDDYDNFVLISGDGDFIPLVKYLKGYHKKTVVISDSSHLNNNLIKTANQTIYLKDIKDYIS